MERPVFVVINNAKENMNGLLANHTFKLIYYKKLSTAKKTITANADMYYVKKRRICKSEHNENGKIKKLNDN